ncbi:MULTISPECIES: carboxypeptidase-like regulatory domain-containing protein [unclassified Flavobacterium]|uniref:carboxypeptidase-like regulatory domain-containing protein n=1 Tax=unclassified Flavobacterium TaxID=196869 RepID=UPI001291A319|nr:MULTISPECIES: carboxypeptidase-like regulatory domain-containing protein [unclassified Flavobacterium]MQP53573.1 carboxypeptidase regulatory-like domain-containing protein [Flavobacterium sp. LMO9]MQP63478.1 carboxypeptidase regulatory-like domain-containing protein [Flavobacterium sp. LMO6]
MKFKILMFILAIATVSCSSDDSNNDPITKANITGSVNLYDEGTTLLDESNMLVKVVGTNPLITALTNSNGQFVLEDVPFGTYTIEYEKAQYGVFKKFNFSHQGNANAITEIPSLGKTSSTEITDLLVNIVNGQVVFSITTSPAGNNSNRRYVRYFLSTSATVSNSNYMYHSLTFISQINPYQSTLTQTELINAGFTSGQTVYVKAYGESYWSNEYLDVNLNKKVFPNLNTVSANAVSFVVP